MEIFIHFSIYSTLTASHSGDWQHEGRHHLSTLRGLLLTSRVQHGLREVWLRPQHEGDDGDDDDEDDDNDDDDKKYDSNKDDGDKNDDSNDDDNNDVDGDDNLKIMLRTMMTMIMLTTMIMMMTMMMIMTMMIR